MDAYIGEIRIFTGNFAPIGWQLCDGTIYPTSQYMTVFSILGNTYGGDGKTNFAVPNLAGTTLVHQGQGPGLRDWEIGDTNGTDEINLSVYNLPRHTHLVNAYMGAGDTENPSGAIFGGRGKNDFDLTNTRNGTMNPLTISEIGQGLPYNNMQPYLTLNYIICFEGIFPMRPS